MDSSFLHSPEAVFRNFGVDPKRGLTSDQVLKAQKLHGKNELPEEEQTPLWKLILAQFQDQLVIILLVAAVVSFLLALLEEQQSESGGSWFSTAFVEPLVILLILICNATVGVVQESNAEKAIEVC